MIDVNSLTGARTYTRPPAPDLTPAQRVLLDQEWPVFSDAEIARRRTAIEAAMADADVEYLLIYGAGGRGTAVPWLTGWSVTTEVICIVSKGAQDSLFIQYFNHVPFAERLVGTTADVNWGGASTIRTAMGEIERRGGKGKRVGVMGPLPFGPANALGEMASDIVNMNGAYTKMRMVKSAEELDWFRIGAALSDLAVDALLTELRPGLTEHDLGDIIEHAYVPWGGRTGIHFLGVTSMAAPDLYVPQQFTSNNVVQAGDVVFTEITASFFDYSGQVLRSIAVDCEPTPVYRELHDVAEAAFDAICAVAKPGGHCQELIEAGKLIEQAAFIHCDDLIHGYGGGYLPPVLGLPSRRDEPTPDITLEAGMMMVVQPNVTTLDKTAGIQTGECVVVTEGGAVSIHRAPRGFLQVGSGHFSDGADDGG